MGIAALVVWILTAGGGAVMLAKWVGGGGHRRPSNSHLPPGVVFGHFGLAAAGLVLWIVYLAADNRTIGWIAIAALAVVAILGFVLLARWVPTYRARQTAGGQSTAPPPEHGFPVAIVVGHGVLAVATVILALLAIR